LANDPRDDVIDNADIAGGRVVEAHPGEERRRSASGQEEGGPQGRDRVQQPERPSVKMDWELLTMANLHLTTTEHRYYGDIFVYCCDNADSDSVPVVKVAELLRSANLPRDVTMKVRKWYFGRVLRYSLSLSLSLRQRRDEVRTWRSGNIVMSRRNARNGGRARGRVCSRL